MVAKGGLARAGAAATGERPAAALLPRSSVGAVRLREAAGARAAASHAEIRRAQGAHLHADDQDAGHTGGVSQPVRVSVLSPGRLDAAGATPDSHAAFQHGPSIVRVHPEHALGRVRHQPHRRGHRRVLRLRLEPGDGSTGAGSRAPHRTDQGGAHLPTRVQGHHRGEHPEEIHAEARARSLRHPGGQLQHGTFQEDVRRGGR